ncbi:MAG: hypothetical protein V4858_09060 [Pseudomonadota bacterium]
MALIAITLAPALSVELSLTGTGSSATVGKPPTVVVTALFEMMRGPQGVPGTPGGAGGATYTHTQSIALAVWTVAHNLGRFPSITITDPLGRVIVPDVEYLDNNLVQITHGLPLAGFAYCN